jgi:hypothetical protein
MNSAMKMAIAVAAVVVAIAGISLLPGSGIGPAGSTPSPTASPSAVPLPATGALVAGTYYIPTGPVTPARITFTVPAGWSTSEQFVYKNRGGPVASIPPDGLPGYRLFTPWIVSHVYADVCHWQGTLVAAGTTVDQLVSVLKAQKGRVVTDPTDVTLGGFPAKRIQLTVAADLEIATCDDGIVRFWPDPGPDESGGMCCSPAGSIDVVYVVDVPGQPFTVTARHQQDTTATELAELDAIVASIKIGP